MIVIVRTRDGHPVAARPANGETWTVAELTGLDEPA